MRNIIGYLGTIILSNPNVIITDSRFTNKIDIYNQPILRRCPRHVENEVAKRVENPLTFILLASLRDMRMHTYNEICSVVDEFMCELLLINVGVVDELISPMDKHDAIVAIFVGIQFRPYLLILRQTPIER